MLASPFKQCTRTRGARPRRAVSRTSALAATNAALAAEIAERKQAEAALRDSEERFRSVLENSLDAAYRRNLQTDRYDYLSPVFESITGISAAEMAGDDIGQVLARVHPDDAAALGVEIERLFRVAQAEGRATGSVEYRFKGRDGQYLWLADHITVLTDERGTPLYRLGIVQDITERKQAEADLRHTRDELESLLTISGSLVSTLELSPLLDTLLQQLRTVIDFDGAAIYLLNGNDLTVTEYVGPMGREEALAVRLPLSECIACHDVVVEQRTVLVDDMLGDSYLARTLRTNSAPIQRQLSGHCRSWLGVPLLVKGEAIGMLRLSHVEPNHFSAQQARLAGSVANHAAVAIENARLYEQVQEAAALEERQRLARELHDSVSQVLYGIGLVANVASAALDRNPDKARRSIEQIQAHVATGLSEMRALILELRPELLVSEGLVSAIEKQALALHERRGLCIETVLCDEPQVPDATKEALYRIALEAMNNAARHGRPERIDVKMTCDATGLMLRVSDDGVGFDPHGSYPGHLGLQSMRERAAKVGAKLAVHSAPGRGACVELRLPPSTLPAAA